MMVGFLVDPVRVPYCSLTLFAYSFRHLMLQHDFGVDQLMRLTSRYARGSSSVPQFLQLATVKELQEAGCSGRSDERDSTELGR